MRSFRLPNTLSFWSLAVLLGFFLFAASAPSPLYAIYARIWSFSPTTITAIYAVYAAGALGALLLSGRLPDHLGRRPMVILALVIQIGGMLAFIQADGVGSLYLGRILQGIGTGIASGAISAWLVDLEPAEHPRLGSVVTGIALLTGLGSGALVSSLLVEYAPDPLRLVFWILTGIYGAALVATFLMPDDVAGAPGAIRSMRPQVAVPSEARAQFASTTPSLIAIWALAGLYLALGPALAVMLARSDNRVVGGLVIAVLMGGGAVASAFVQAIDPRQLIIRGSLVVVVGVALTLIAVVIDSTPLLYGGSLLAGVGLGLAFSGSVRSLGPLAPPEKRGALFAAVYIVIYVAISVPTVIAGLAVTRYGLRDTTYAYGLVVMALATVTFVAILRRRPPEAIA